MKKRSVLVCAIAAFALSAPSSAHANHSWDGLHWARAANPFSVTLVDSLDATWDAYLPPVSADWARSTVLDTTIVPGASDLVTRAACLPSAGVVVTCNANYGPNLWLGLATVWLDGEHITQGLVQVNDFYFSMAGYNTPDWRRMVLCQEVGHTFGLDHTDETFDNANQGTCMDYTDNPLGPPSNVSPNQHDYDQLAATYTHLDGTGGGPPNCKGKGCNKARGGRDTVITRFGDTTVIQYILWAQ